MQMAKMTELFPPYAGEQPFLYLCFSDSDAKRVRPLLGRLFSRGCRIWYTVGQSGTVSDRKLRDARMQKARLVVLYQTARARADQVVKSAVLVCQSKGIPVVSIDTDKEESTLSMGLSPHTPHIRARGEKAIEDALLHADGFTQELIGSPQKVRETRLVRIAAIVFLAALALIGAMLAYRRLKPPPVELPSDTVTFSDPGLTQAVRDALEGGPITEESIGSVTALHLDAIPTDPEELLKLKNLAVIEIDQSLAPYAQDLSDRYRVVLTGGGQ